MHRSAAEIEAEMRVAQDYRRFLGEAEQLLQSARQLSGDSAVLMRQRLEDRVAQAKVSLESMRSTTAQRYRTTRNGGGSHHAKLLWGAGAALAGLALAGYVYRRKAR